MSKGKISTKRVQNVRLCTEHDCSLYNFSVIIHYWTTGINMNAGDIPPEMNPPVDVHTPEITLDPWVNN